MTAKGKPSPKGDPRTGVKRKTIPANARPVSKPKPTGLGRTWRSLLQCRPVKDATGAVTGFQPLPNIYNVSLILMHHPAWKGSLFYDEFAEQIVKTKRVPGVGGLDNAHSQPGPWTDADTEAARVWLQAVEKVQVSVRELVSAVIHASRQSSRHPVREYLREVRWDGKDRLSTVLIDYFGVEDSEYARGVGRLWFISAVARVMRPGCQADYALVLESPQGWKKNQALRNLVPEKAMFSDTGITLGNKDSYQNLHGVWIYCLDEMASVHGAEVKTMRNFLTGTVDRYRPSYGHFPQNFARQNVFICTINPEAGGYFADRTGNRRFWPVKMTKPADVKSLVKVRDQLWAEAKARFDRKEDWWPDARLTALCEGQQAKRVQIDPWTEVIAKWIRDNCPFRGEDGSLVENMRVPIGRGVSTSEILWHALNVGTHQMGKGPAMRAAQCLRDLGFSDSQQETHDGVRDRYYRPGAPKPVPMQSAGKGPAPKGSPEVVQLKKKNH